MQQYICCACGHKSPTCTKAKCSKTLTGYHIYMPEHDGDYICKHCGHKSKTCSSALCRNSPSGYHEYM